MTIEEFHTRLLAIRELELQANSKLNELLNEFSENENSMTISEIAEGEMNDRMHSGDIEMDAGDFIDALTLFRAHR